MEYKKIYDKAYKEAYDWNKKLIENKPIEIQIAIIRIKERQKYHYYTECSDGWTTTEDIAYNAAWDAIIQIVKELEA